MDLNRLLLFAALGLVLMLLWEAWQQDYGPQPPVAGTNQSEPAVSSLPATADNESVPTVPAQPGEAATAATGQSAVPATSSAALPSAQRIYVQTDLLDIEIDTLGGDIRVADLRKFPVSIDQPDKPLRLMNDQLPDLFIVQGGLLSHDAAPTHQSRYVAEQSRYVLADGADTLNVQLVWSDPAGVTVTKVFRFQRGSYATQISYIVDNQSGKDWTGSQYAQLQRTDREKPAQSSFIYTYTGGATSSPEKRYEKINFDDMEESSLSRDVTGGWTAMLEHYFVSALVPRPDQQYHYYSKVLDGSRYIMGLYGPSTRLADNATTRFDMQLYIGPKDQEHLKELAPGLELTVDYGWLWFIAQPLFWLLTKIHGVLGNWGFSIIVVTILIKAAFFRLSASSYRSMANMRRVQPRLLALRERYGNDREKMNREMMNFYKQEKINPLGGCLPILVQIPVFIALYWVLLESVELRQAPFILWITDLSVNDPYYVLPVIMGITMWIQQKLNPAPPDPMQAKVMMALPFVFTVFFAFFPAGLVLYWVVNNTLSIAQQWVITRSIVQPDPA